MTPSRGEFLEKRRTGIGATDISAILGLNPWRSAWDVYADKVGLLDGVVQETNARQRAGKALEEAIARIYSAETGHNLQWSDVNVAHPGRDWHRYTPDALVYEDGTTKISHGLDCKAISISSYWEFGEPGTDQVPDYIALQCQWSMSGADLSRWDVAANTGAETRIYKLTRDKDMEAVLLDTGEKFWKKHVLAKVAPDIKDTESARRYLKAKFPKGNGELKVPTLGEDTAIDQYLIAKAKFKAIEGAKNELEVKIKEIIGDSSGFDLGERGKLTYNLVKGFTRPACDVKDFRRLDYRPKKEKK